MMQNVAQCVAGELARAGVDRIFGLPGGEVLGLIEACRQQGIDFVLTRHEANAGLAAAVYGKLKNAPGAALATLGPGAANLMLPLANSYLDREPLVALSAQLPQSFPRSHTHQLLPLLESYGPVTKFSAAIDPFNVNQVVAQACRTALSQPMGPAFLTLSAADAARPPAAVRSSGSPAAAGDHAGSTLAGEAESVAGEVRKALAKASRPLVLVGIGANQILAPQLRQWLDAWQLPVAVTPKVKGIVDETKPNFVGVVGGMAADALMCDALREADLLIGFGLDPVEIDKLWHAELSILWLLENANAVGQLPAENALLIDHRQLLASLNRLDPPQVWNRPFRTFQEQRQALMAGSSSRSAAMWPADAVRSLAELLPPETIVTTDVGSHKYLFGQFWPSRLPQTFFMSNGLSGMGYGLPAALGAKLARPESPVLAVVGDGGFSMNFQELETMERVNAPVVTLVLSDHSYSLIKLAQEGRSLPGHGVDFNPIDHVKAAEACGVEAVRTNDPDRLAAAVGRAVTDQRSLVVDIPIHYSDYRKIF
ncbi:MAG: thiamine pyrophosphate-binding protein [Thermaerobacterales bacterium]